MSGWHYSWLISGLSLSRLERQALKDALNHAHPNLESVVVHPVVEGCIIDLDFSTIAPFTEMSFEAWLEDNVLPESVYTAVGSPLPSTPRLQKSRPI